MEKYFDVHTLIICWKRKQKLSYLKKDQTHLFKFIFSMSMLNIESTTWFDHLPIEIIFMIFNYLSNNDIVYTFFFFSQRLNNLVLQNQHYFTYLELPITNLLIRKIRWKS
jgi:hypothetical protein